MLQIILLYSSLFFQIAAAIVAISLFKQTKFNVSWILISTGFLIMTISRLLDLSPRLFPEFQDTTNVFKCWLAFITSVVFLFGVFYIRKIFQFLKRVDEIRKENEKRVVSAVLRTEEKERQRFAKELHDGIGPLLSVVKMLLSAMDSSKSKENNLKIKININQAVDEAIVSVRNISANISPHILNDFGLHYAVDAFIERMSLNESLTIEFDSNIKDKRFGYDSEVVMYRVISELINNTLRHAKATKISINLNLDESLLYLDYYDNGVGFDITSKSFKKGMGLDNIRYRLQSAHGDLKIISGKEGGMNARAFIKV